MASTIEHQTYTPDELVDQAQEQLKEAGFKNTQKRQEILALFSENQRYLSAKYIHEQLTNKYPTMSYNTTYRNIYDFVEIGILEATEYNQEQLFRIHCMGEEHHHHFICTNCGRTRPIEACPMEQVSTGLEDVQVEFHRFEIFGLCENCFVN